MIIPQEQILNLHQSIETPALIVDLQQLEKNIEAMQNLANENAVRLRPHIKTHKSVFISKLLLKHGAEGITVAKVSEAEVMAAAGISDIFIANQITHPTQLIKGYGKTLNIDGEIIRLSEEHGVIKLKSGQSIRLGSPVIIIPNHACAVANLFSHYHLVDSSGKIKQIPVDARGKSQ